MSERNHESPNWVDALGVDDVKLEPYFVKAMEKGKISLILEEVEGFDLPLIEKLVLTLRIGQYITEMLLTKPEAMEE